MHFFFVVVIFIVIIYWSLEIARLKRQSVEIIRIMVITSNQQWPELYYGGNPVFPMITLNDSQRRRQSHPQE